MKEGENKIDNLFKKRLEDPAHNLAYNEDDWDALEQMLDKGKKSPFIVYWLPIVSGIAALLLLFVGWWFFKPAQVTTKPDVAAVVKPAPHKLNNDTIRKSKPLATVSILQNNVAVKPGTVSTSGGANPAANKKHAQAKKAIEAVSTGEAILAVSGINTFQQKNILPVAVQKDTVLPVKADMVAMHKDTTPPALVNLAKADGGQAIVADAAPVAAPEKVKVKMKSFSPNRPQFALGVIASSDINGVNSFQQSKVGSNFGATVSASIKKWTFTTGVVYSIKPYATTFENYTTAYQFKQNPTNVTADCRMLDIPLNIGYQVYRYRKDKLSLGTGLSSYFMLHESYKYTYPSAYFNGPAGYKVANPKNYLLSAINLNATFEHQVNSKFSLSVQPYMKLPLKAVGYSQVNLHTAGVAVGFNWNINSFTKPK